MPHYTTIAFQNVELKALWTRLTGGDTSTDAELDQAAERALEKVWRNLKGMPRKANPEPLEGRKAGRPLDLRRPA